MMLFWREKSFFFLDNKKTDVKIILRKFLWTTFSIKVFEEFMRVEFMLKDWHFFNNETRPPWVKVVSWVLFPCENPSRRAVQWVPGKWLTGSQPMIIMSVDQVNLNIKWDNLSREKSRIQRKVPVLAPYKWTSVR